MHLSNCNLECFIGFTFKNSFNGFTRLKFPTSVTHQKNDIAIDKALQNNKALPRYGCRRDVAKEFENDNGRC